MAEENLKLEELALLPSSGYIRLSDLSKFLGIREGTLKSNLRNESLVKCQQGHYLVALHKLTKPEPEK